MPTAKPNVDYLPDHQKHILSENTQQKGLTTLRKGSIVTLTYKGEKRWVLIVDPGYEGKIHLLDLKYVPRERLLPLIKKIKTQKLLSNQTFFERVIHKKNIMSLDAYRTYFVKDVTGYKEVVYNTEKP